MKGNLKILLAAFLAIALFTQDKMCEHLGFGQTKDHKASTDLEQIEELNLLKNPPEDDFFVNDSLYRWDEQLLHWATVGAFEEYQAVLAAYPPAVSAASQPIEIRWEVLMDIQYRLRYFKELNLEMYAPVFGNAQKALDGKEVIIEGFVIPFDAEEELLSLSANPYASCFFCGKASPASVISMYLSNKGKRYKMDDFKKFSGTLHLNTDDPNEFYYILRDAKEE